MKRAIRGFTLIELVVTILILLVFVAFVGTRANSCMTEDVSILENEAAVFANKLGFSVEGVSCMNQDTDGDGYVSCTVRVSSKDTPGAQTLILGCASTRSWFLSGCKRLVTGNIPRDE